MPLGGKYDKLQTSHIKVGGTEKLPQSTYMDYYKPHDMDAARRVLSEATMADLRRSHFNTNEDPSRGTGMSETRAEYIPRDGTMREAAEDLHHKRDNIALGTDARNYLSTSAADFQPHTDAKRVFVDPQFQKSHFRPGHDHDYFKTNNQVDFTPYSAKQLQDNFQITNETITKLQRSHFSANEGMNDPKNYQSEMKTSFVPLDQNAHIVHDLTRFQASHFSVADKHDKYPMSSTNEQLSATAAMPRGLISTQEHADRERFLRSSHIQVGLDNSGNYVSETRNQFAGLDQHDPSAMLRPDLVNTKEHVCYPEKVPKQYQTMTEMQANFQPMTNTAAEETKATAEKIMAVMKHPTDPNCQKQSLEHGDYKSTTAKDYVPTANMSEGRGQFIDIKHLKSNIQLSGWGGGSYTTANREMLQETAQYAGKKLASPIDNKLWRSDVIVAGTHDPANYQSEMKCSYRPKDDVSKITVEEDVKHRLQRTHYELGDSKGTYQTEFNDNFISRDNYVEDGKYIGYAPNDIGEMNL